MGESRNIQNMLETGYFTTSRARSTAPLVQPPVHNCDEDDGGMNITC